MTVPYRCDSSESAPAGFELDPLDVTTSVPCGVWRPFDGRSQRSLSRALRGLQRHTMLVLVTAAVHVRIQCGLPHKKTAVSELSRCFGWRTAALLAWKNNKQVSTSHAGHAKDPQQLVDPY